MNNARAQARLLNQFCVFIFVFIFVNALSVFAGPSRTTYQARIVKPDGYPLEGSNINFKFTILDTSGSCILYAETYSAVNMGSSGGLVSFSLGTGVRTFPVSGSTFEQVFSNTTASLTCDAGGPATYSPSANDTRKIVMQFNDGAGWQTLPAMTINAVPYAMYANDSLKFNGKDITDFVQVASLPTCSASEAVRFNGAGFSCVAVGGTSTSVTSGAVLTALGYTPADGASVTALSSSLTTANSTISNVSSTVASVSSTVYSVSSTVTSLQNSVAASFAAITSSQWTTSGTDIFYSGAGNVGVATSNPTSLFQVGAVSAFMVDANSNLSLNGAPFPAAPLNRGIFFSNVQDSAGAFAGRIGFSTPAGVPGLTFYNNQGVMRTDVRLLTQSGGLAFGTGTTSAAPSVQMVLTASGNVGIGTTTPVAKLDVSGAIRIGVDNSSCTAALAGTLRYNGGAVEYCNGTSWAAFGVSGAGLTLLNGSASNTQTFANGTTGTAPAFNTANGIHTLNIPLASAATTTAGLISYADYTNFTNKQAATSAAVAATLGYTPADSATVTTLSSTVSSVSSTVASVSSTVNTVSNSVTSLQNSAAASFAAITSSQWTTSGTKIYYNTGFVGIGTSAPSVALDVVGNIKASSTIQALGGIDMQHSAISRADLIQTDAVAGMVLKTSAGSAPIVFQPAGSVERMRVDYTGNVGIGTSAPTARLQVAANDSATAISATNASITLQNMNATSSALNTIMFANRDNFANAAISTVQTNLGNQGNRMILQTKMFGSGSWNTDQLVLDTSGYVGIGTSSPGSPLEVVAGAADGIRITRGASSSAITKITAPYGANVTTLSVYGASVTDFVATGGGSGGMVIGGGYAGNVVTPPANSLLVQSMIGVGQVSPTAKLHIGSGSTTVAPLKFTSGVLTASPQSGTMEYDGAAFYLTDGANVRRMIATGSSAGTIDNASVINSTGNISMVPVGSVIVSSTTASTNSSTGALVVNGGLGVAGAANIAGNLNTSGTLTATGDVVANNMKAYVLSRATPASVDDYIELGRFNYGNRSYNLKITLTIDAATIAITKVYVVPIRYVTSSTWFTLLPISQSIWGSDNHEIDLLPGTFGDANAYLRLRRSAGSVAATANIKIEQDGYAATTFTALNATGSTSAPASYFESTALTQYNNKVGIGTSNPGATFEVKASGVLSTGGWRLLSSTTSNSVVTAQDSNSGDAGLLTVRAANTDKIKLNSAGDSYFNGGYVGFNTTSPTDARVVISHTASAPVVGARGESKLAFNASFVGYGQGPRLINLYPTDTVDGHGIGLSNGLTELYTNANFGFFVRPNRADINGTFNSTEVMRLSSLGNLGVGTSSPASRLHVADNNAVLMTLERQNNQNSLIEYKNTLGSMYSGLITSTSDWGVGTGNDLGTSAVFRVANNGRVYIGGTTTPTARLHITPGTSSVAPIKLVAGTLLTTPQSGTIEYDGTDYYITDNNNVRRTIATEGAAGTLNDISTVSSTSGITLWPAAGNSVVVSSTVASTNSSTGALVVNGGLGVAGAANIGGALNVTGVLSGAATIKATGYRANQGVPDAADSSTLGYAFGADGDTGMFSPIVGGGSANGVLAFFSNNAEKMRLTNSGLGIGTTSPGMPLDIMTTGSLTQRLYLVSNNANDDANLILARARGTSTTPTAVQSGDALGGLYFRGYDGSGISSSSAYIAVSAEQNFTGGTKGTSMKFGSTVAGTGSYQEIMRIDSTGFVGIGSTSPNALLQVGPSGSQSSNYNMYVGSYNGSSGQSQYVGNWKNSGYWGLGPATSSNTDNTLRLGNSTNTTGTWSGTQNLNLVMGGALAVGSATVGTYSFQSVKDFNGIQSQTAAFIGGIDAGTTNTGIYVVQKDNTGLSSANTYLLNVVHNNNSKMVVTGAGSVGIGTTSPAAKLDVVGSNPYIYISNTNAATKRSGLLFSSSGTAQMEIGTDAGLTGTRNFYIWDSVSATSRVFIDGNGNVGVGTTNPTYKFQVSKTTSATPAMMISGGFAGGPRLQSYGLDADPLAWMGLGTDMGGGPYELSVYTSAPGQNGKITFGQYSGATQTYTERMRIAGDGKVGIGTNNPQAQLHVVGDVRIVDGNQAAGRVLASDANGTAAWKQTIIHGTINSTANTSTTTGQHVSTGVSITLPPGRWQITGMGITTAASCRADLGIRTLADAVVKYTLMPAANGDFQTATVTGYVDIATTTTYELYISSRAVCNSQVHVDNSLWELTATGVAY